jgi:hypothetical protein
MISAAELRRTARARLADAEVLLKSRRYDAAVYICGYAVEIALKARICRTLHWAGYPSTPAEFERYRTFQTHDLDVLLNLSGRARTVKRKAFADWSLVVYDWNPESRYGPVGVVSKQHAWGVIDSARTLIGAMA